MKDMAPNGLLLSIDQDHVDSIFSGAKKYELRKALPRTGFSRVFLFQTKGAGVVGWFDIGRLYHLAVDELWGVVGTLAAPRSRFEAYFDGSTKGYALEILRPGRFSDPISSDVLRRLYPRFSAPMSSTLLRPGHILFEFLFKAFEQEMAAKAAPVRLESISKTAVSRFRKLVMQEIRPSYDEIDDSFVDGIIETQEEGYDLAGFFTVSKEALAVKQRSGRIVGFTTITYKSGGSAKTGPTMLEREFRGQGLGQGVRVALEHRILLKGYRKVYCTAPATSYGVVKYLLRAGYQIEAHLRQQYTRSHDELVFGKLLLPDLPELFLEEQRFAGGAARVLQVDAIDPEECAAQIARVLRAAWFPFEDNAADRVAEDIALKRAEIAKPKTAVLLMSGREAVGAAFLLPKRGGSIKMLLVPGTHHTPSIIKLLQSALATALGVGGHRVYVLHPVGNGGVLDVLRAHEFTPEGLLRAPYAPGQDVVVYGRALSSNTLNGT